MTRFIFRFCIAVMAALAASGPATALTLNFTGSGQVAPSGPPNPDGSVPFAVFATHNNFGDGALWQLASPFTFDFGSGTGSGTFAFSSGANSLSGSVTTAAVLAGINISYNVLAGTGQYADYIGMGQSFVTFLGDPLQPPTPYTETGMLDIAPIPEASTYVLLLAGLAAVAVATRRRRHADRAAP